MVLRGVWSMMVGLVVKVDDFEFVQFHAKSCAVRKDGGDGAVCIHIGGIDRAGLYSGNGSGSEEGMGHV